MLPQGMNLKFNVDGFFQSGYASVGGISRNSVRETLGYFSMGVVVQ